MYFEYSVFSKLVAFDNSHPTTCTYDNVHNHTDGGGFWENNECLCLFGQTHPCKEHVPDSLTIKHTAFSKGICGPQLSFPENVVGTIGTGTASDINQETKPQPSKGMLDLERLFRESKGGGSHYSSVIQARNLQTCPKPTPNIRTENNRKITFENGYLLANEKRIFDFILIDFECVKPPKNYDWN